MDKKSLPAYPPPVDLPWRLSAIGGMGAALFYGLPTTPRRQERELEGLGEHLRRDVGLPS